MKDDTTTVTIYSRCESESNQRMDNGPDLNRKKNDINKLQTFENETYLLRLKIFLKSLLILSNNGYSM